MKVINRFKQFAEAGMKLRNRQKAVEGRVSNMLSKLQHMYALLGLDGNITAAERQNSKSDISMVVCK